MKKLTTEQFIEKAKSIHNNKYNYSKSIYTGRHNKLIITCPIHGDFSQEAGSHLLGNGCPKCGRENTTKHQRKSLDQFIKDCRKTHGDKYDYSKVDYKGAKTKVCIICPIHGEFWQTPDDHINGKHECPKCVHKNDKYTLQEFINNSKQVHGNKYDYSKVNYINNFTKVEIICPEHGSFWQIPTNHILKKCGCPYCKESKGEKFVYNILKKLNINFIREYEIPLPTSIRSSGKGYIDFYLPDFNIFIEYNGQQHYIPINIFGGKVQLNKQIERDNYVKNYCENNNIKLIELKYDLSKEQIESILKLIPTEAGLPLLEAGRANK